VNVFHIFKRSDGKASPGFLLCNLRLLAHIDTTNTVSIHHVRYDTVDKGCSIAIHSEGRQHRSSSPQRTSHCITMSSEPSNDRKRKPTAQEPEAVVSTGSDNHQSDRKAARRVSTDASACQTTDGANNNIQRNPILSMETIGILIPGLA
jgi:hypothetical protein